MSPSASRRIVEIACDESGFVGGSLFSATRVFAHASVHLERQVADQLMAEVRGRLDAGGSEIKAARLNRAWARPVASWLLAAEGPLAGRAVVHLTDTRLFGLARLVQVLASDLRPEGWWSAHEDEQAWELALELDAALAQLSTARQRDVLVHGRNLLWLRRSRRHAATVQTWADSVHAACHDLPGRRAPTLADLASPAALERARAYVAAPPASPLTEPLLPALRWTVDHWSERGDVTVTHDEQSVLTGARVRAIGADLEARHPGRRLAGLTRVDSREDARVQVADLVAGVVRREVEDALAGAAGSPAIDISHLVAGDPPDDWPSSRAQRSRRKKTSQSRISSGTS